MVMMVTLLSLIRRSFSFRFFSVFSSSAKAGFQAQTIITSRLEITDEIFCCREILFLNFEIQLLNDSYSFRA